MEKEESSRLLQEEKECAVWAAESLRQECKSVGNAIERAKAKRMADFEAYVLGKKAMMFQWNRWNGLGRSMRG